MHRTPMTRMTTLLTLLAAGAISCAQEAPAPPQARAAAPVIAPVVAPATPATPEVAPGAARVPVFGQRVNKALPWSWRLRQALNSVSVDEPLVAPLMDGGSARLTIPVERADSEPRPRLERRDAAGRVVWAHTLNAAPFMGAGEVVAASDRIVVVLHSRVASGAQAFAFAMDGRQAWQTPLVGLGPVDHSKYANEVQLRVSPDQDHALFYGMESQGAYVEARDLRDGKLLSHRTLDSAERALDQRARVLLLTRAETAHEGQTQVVSEGDGAGRREFQLVQNTAAGWVQARELKTGALVVHVQRAVRPMFLVR